VITKLIFVYNANAGKINSLLDSAHKLISPGTYDCKLCELTYGVFKEDVDWIRFRESVKTTNPNLQLEFLHKDEFEKQYWSKWLPKYDFPIILGMRDEVQDYNDGFGTNLGLDVFMDATEMNTFSLTEELVNSMKLKLEKL
jgi:hypothetical protein